MLLCPAKINLSLSVGPPRAADRMHPIASWMVAVSLFDELTVERCSEKSPPPRGGDQGVGSSFDIAFHDDAPRKCLVDWPVEKDLIFKAHRLVEELAGRKLPIRAVLRKRIPTGAGLGGGSSDAAGMLLSLNRLFQLGLSHDTLTSLAVKLGSDVPFFLGVEKHPSAVVRGLGEIVEPTPLHETMHLTLILPDLHCNTAAVYRKFDELTPHAKLRTISARSRSVGLLINDLAQAAYAVEPRLGELRAQCSTALDGKPIHITGSGAALFTIQPDEPSAIAAAARIRQKCHVPAVPVKTIG